MFKSFLATAPFLFILPAAAGSTWTSMFNGVNLEGWDGDPAHWEVRDSAISPKGSISSNTFLIWKDLEGDFIMEADVYVAGTGEANSGIQFRSKGARTGASGPRWKVCGPQADLGPEKNGCLYQECLGRIIPPDSSKCRSAARADGWNRYVLKVDKENWSVRMNGTTCFDHKDRAGSLHSVPGLVALQYHTPGYAVRFKNLRIQRIEAPTSIAPGRTAPGRSRPSSLEIVPGWRLNGRRSDGRRGDGFPDLSGRPTRIP